MVFKRLMQAMGVGGPSVETVLANPNCRPGGFLEGQVHVMGGDHAVVRPDETADRPHEHGERGD